MIPVYIRRTDRKKFFIHIQARSPDGPCVLIATDDGERVETKNDRIHEWFYPPGTVLAPTPAPAADPSTRPEWVWINHSHAVRVSAILGLRKERSQVQPKYFYKVELPDGTHDVSDTHVEGVAAALGLQLPSEPKEL